MLAALISAARTSVSRLIIAASSARVIGPTTKPSAASFSFTDGSLKILVIVSPIRATSGAGVAAGANTPSQDDISNPGIVSPIVGTSGIAA